MMFFFFFFNDTATTEIYTLSLHDALPISDIPAEAAAGKFRQDLLFRLNTVEVRLPPLRERPEDVPLLGALARSEEHTSELQSQSNLVCRLLLEKKNKTLRSLLKLRCLDK